MGCDCEDIDNREPSGGVEPHFSEMRDTLHPEEGEAEVTGQGSLILSKH